MKLTPRVQYFWDSLLNCPRDDRRACRNCGFSGENAVIERKYLVTKLVDCTRCRLRFRTPTDPVTFNQTFYQEAYSEEFSSVCSDDQRLLELTRSGFKGREKDFSRFIRLFQLLDSRASLRICDFGTSGGYGAWQFQQAARAFRSREAPDSYFG